MPEIIKLIVTSIGLHGWIVLSLGQMKKLSNGEPGACLGLTTVTLVGISMTILGFIWWFDWPRTIYTLGPAFLLFAGAATAAAINLGQQVKREAQRPPSAE